MKEEAGVLPIRRLLAVGTEARVSVGRQHPTAEPSSRRLRAPSSPASVFKRPRSRAGSSWPLGPTATPGGQRPWCRPVTAKPSRMARLSLPHDPPHRHQPGTLLRAHGDHTALAARLLPGGRALPATVLCPRLLGGPGSAGPRQTAHRPTAQRALASPWGALLWPFPQWGLQRSPQDRVTDSSAWGAVSPVSKGRN